MLKEPGTSAGCFLSEARPAELDSWLPVARLTPTDDAFCRLQTSPLIVIYRQKCAEGCRIVQKCAEFLQNFTKFNSTLTKFCPEERR